MCEPQNLLHRRRKYPLEVSEDERILEGTASTLLRLRFSILETLRTHGTYEDLQTFQQFIKDDLDKITRDGSPESLPFKIRVTKYAKNLSSEDLDRIVSKPIKSDWYRDAIHMRIAACETAREEEEVQNFQFFDETHYCAQDSAYKELRDIVDISETLCMHVEKAAASGCLQKHIKFLKEQLQKMHENTEEGREYLGIEHKPLGFPNDAGQEKIPNGPSNSPRITSIEQPKARSALAFLVPVICTLSAIPAYFAWDHAENNPGRATDSNFLQLLASAPIQLLGIFTALWPIIKNFRPDRAAWIQSWTLAILSFCLTIAAVPLYLLASASWSAMSLFAGSFMQSFLQLQLILGIPRQKVHED